MDYQTIYDGLIHSAKTRRSVVGYTENHHIIPRCLGGDDSPSNMVKLTAREHYLSHWMLFKIHRCNKTAFAWNSMSGSRYRDKRGYTSKTFAYARSEWASRMSVLNKGKKFSDETKKRMSESAMGRTPWNKGVTLPKKKTAANIEYEKNPSRCSLCDNPIKFRFRTRNKYCSRSCLMSDMSSWAVLDGNKKPNESSFKTGHVVSKGVAGKISASLKGLKRPRGECIHCGKEGAISLLKRWHFDNCKFRGAENGANS